ncbi:ArsR/SmtB family transcription factor [Corynebacterium epidermidicanis]|nr:metalloregulator ArsR/SmtB family transcription factor [Corynebacterium epidermidicanis]
MTFNLPIEDADACCPAVMLPADATKVVELLKSVADSTRLRLLFLVAERGCENVCGCDLAEAMGVSAPTITHHMKKLTAVGLVERVQQGKWAHYTINIELFQIVKNLVDSVYQPIALDAA